MTRSEHPTSACCTPRDLLRSGRWLPIGASAGPTAGFVIGILITQLASAADLGLSEAARITAEPILVLAIGLSAVLRPPSMEAAINRHNGDARRNSRRFTLGLGIVAMLYFATLSLPEATIPLRVVMPRAFVLPGSPN